MKLQSMLPFRFSALWLAALAAAVRGDGDGLSQEYCSSENTASDYNAVYDIYQSNGACFQQCARNYAFAVVQYQDCWCSNYIPADQQSTGSCNQNCPGYPDDLCGNKNDGLYGYIKMPNVQPSGTAGASSSTQASSSSSAAPSSSEPVSTSIQPSSTPQSTPQSSSTAASSQQPSTSYVSQTVSQTVTQSQSASVVVSYVTPTQSSSSDPPTSSSPTSTHAPSSDPPSSTTSSTDTPVVAPVPATTQAAGSSATASVTPSPVTSIRVVTYSGAVVTQTVTSTPNVALDSNPQNQALQRKRVSDHAIAGIVIGSIIGTAAVLIGAFLLWRKRRQNADAKDAAVDTGRDTNSPRRNISVLSKTGLLYRGHPASITEKDYDDQMYGNTGGNNSVRHSMLYGAGAIGEGVSPVSPLGSSHEKDSSRRFSRPLVYDQRLNPSALFANAEANGSRVSMQDQQDYCRPNALGIANPDPRPSFDSRDSGR